MALFIDRAAVLTCSYRRRAGIVPFPVAHVCRLRPAIEKLLTSIKWKGKLLKMNTHCNNVDHVECVFVLTFQRRLSTNFAQCTF